jgi:hypothetical protein
MMLCFYAPRKNKASFFFPFFHMFFIFPSCIYFVNSRSNLELLDAYAKERLTAFIMIKFTGFYYCEGTPKCHRIRCYH